ncbi:MAG: aminomethyl-transferring glycine dehydrogenase [Bacteroidales bacterium]|nr:aminomethyl-transferring glycine dehydrogenase [Bacteroidales bacterium]
MKCNNFVNRHNGVSSAADEAKMLEAIGVKSMDELIEKAVPSHIRLKEAMPIADGISEYQFLNRCKELAAKNKVYKTYIGMGYYGTITPAVIMRNVFENAGWYTAYTPYQTEISQGRLEALMTYQTMVADMTKLPLSNASLLDEATAGGEAMIMFYNSRSRQQVKDNVSKFFVDEGIFPQTLDVMRTNAAPRGIEIVTGKASEIQLDNTFFGAVVQYPNQYGDVKDYTEFIAKAHELGIFVGMATDLMALAVLKAPGEMGADCAFGSNQRFGLPMGFGGPHAGFFAVTEAFKRQFPGRIIGWSIDAKGNPALRMALGMREQHIKRDKATSNICTASALVAIMSGFYAAYHGPEGIRHIAEHIHKMALRLNGELAKYGYKQHNQVFFDTLAIQCPVKAEKVMEVALKHHINFRQVCDECIGISLDETTTRADLNEILNVLAEAAGKTAEPLQCCCKCGDSVADVIPEALRRTSAYLTAKVFNSYHSETEMMRYMKKLEVKDLSLNRAMIPLGSCTMKLNAAAEMLPLSWSEFGAIHPFVPANQAEGYLEMIKEIEDLLAIVTGFAGVSLQPNAGSAGEYSGLTVIRNYHIANGQAQRNVCLIPASAHGTNPASAAKAGMTVVVVKCNERGDVDIDDLKAKAEQYRDTLSCLMITYPSTHGAFEEGIIDIIKIIHDNGGLVYMDGANMNAQVGLTSPGYMGADVCHLNLHKTFAMPHGGGGPGVGPIAVSAKLVDFLPKHPVVKVGGSKGNTMAAAPYGSAMLLPITYGYLLMLGGNGLTEATKHAILNANYLRARLQKYYKILYTNKNGMCGHEMIVDFAEFSLKIGVGDIARRLDDYGFHAPTVAFPVHNTLMVEPTESEPLSELDRLVDALVSIRQEIDDVMTGKYEEKNNPIANAPHTMQVVCADEWNYPYSRQTAAFPQPHDDKYWPTISKIDDAYGDRNLQPVWPEGK